MRPPAGTVRSDWLRLGVLAVLLLTILVIFIVHGVPTPAELRSTVAGAGLWAPAFFVLLFAVATLALFPVTLFALAAGLLFGPVAGVLLVWVGAMLGATACFGVGRGFSRPTVRRLTGSGRAGAAVDRLETFLARRGVVAVIMVRLVPVVPFGPSCYLAGATGLRLRDFMVGTAIGIVPGVVVYTVLAGTAEDPGSPAFLASAVALVLLLVVTTAISRRRRVAR